MEKNEITFDENKWYSTTEVVQLAKQGYAPFKSLGTLYSIIQAGKIPVVIRGDENRKKYYIQGKDLVTFSESQKVSVTNKDEEQMQTKRSKTKK